MNGTWLSRCQSAFINEPQALHPNAGSPFSIKDTLCGVLGGCRGNIIHHLVTDSVILQNFESSSSVKRPRVAPGVVSHSLTMLLDPYASSCPLGRIRRSLPLTMADRANLAINYNVFIFSFLFYFFFVVGSYY